MLPISIMLSCSKYSFFKGIPLHLSPDGTSSLKCWYSSCSWGLLLSWGLPVWRAAHIKSRLGYKDLKNENYKPPPNKLERQEEGRSVTALILGCAGRGWTRAQSRQAAALPVLLQHFPCSQCQAGLCSQWCKSALAAAALLEESRLTVIIPINWRSTFRRTTDLLCTPATRTKG